MANVTISQLNSGSSLSGSEVLPIVQGGSTVKTTVQDIANLAGGGVSSIEILANGTVVNQNSNVQYNTYGVITNVSGNQSVAAYLVPSLYLQGGTATTITFSTLETVAINMQSFSSLTTVNFPALTTVYFTGMSGLSISNCPNLTTITIPVLTNILGGNGYYQFSSNALSQATVDDILVKFAATTASNCSLYLDGGSNAAPSSIGVAAKSTLLNRGWSVQTN